MRPGRRCGALGFRRRARVPSRRPAVTPGTGEEVLDLRVSVGGVSDRSSFEKSLAQVTDSALDLALLLRRADVAHARLGEQFACDLEQHRVEAHGGSVSFERDDARVVEEPLAHRTLEELMRAQQRSSQRRRAQVPDELGEEHPGVAQHHHEEPQIALRSIDGALSHERPIDLRLLARERLEAHGDGPRGLRSMTRDVATNAPRRAGISALAQHVEQPRRAKRWVLRERLRDEVFERRERRRRRARRRDALGRTQVAHALDDVVVERELSGDGSDLPVLAKEERAHAGRDLIGDGHGASRRASGARRSDRQRTRRTRAWPIGTGDAKAYGLRADRAASEHDGRD
jgi:hypothetical protein